jgi:hypothetical protein
MRTFRRTSRLTNKSILSSFCAQQGKDEIFHLRRHIRQFRRPASYSNFHSYRTSIDTTTKIAGSRTIITISVQEVNIANYDDDNDDDSNNSNTTMSQQQQQQQQQQHIQHNLAEIIRPYFEEQKPVVVRGAVLSTPATNLWSSWEYWEEKGGEQETNVSVEIGGSYGNSTDPDSEQRVEISFLAYLQFLQLFEERYGRTGSIDDFYHYHHQSDEGGSSNNSNSSSSTIPTNNELVYMAQNDLFPSLYKDVMIPDFCCAEDDDNKESISNKDSDKNNNNNNTSVKAVGYGRLYSAMMWLGPRGCVSPLHFDPLDNCFMQHQGRKRVLLFPPSPSPPTNESSFWHYAGHEGQQSNTSPINPEILDWQQSTTEQQKQDETSSSDSTIYDAATFKSYSKKYPLFFKDAPTRMECLLHPGDLLYIPKKWWHHVRSIDTAASVNVWWR